MFLLYFGLESCWNEKTSDQIRVLELKDLVASNISPWDGNRKKSHYDELKRVLLISKQTLWNAELKFI